MTSFYIWIFQFIYKDPLDEPEKVSPLHSPHARRSILRGWCSVKSKIAIGLTHVFHQSYFDQAHEVARLLNIKLAQRMPTRDLTRERAEDHACARGRRVLVVLHGPLKCTSREQQLNGRSQALNPNLLQMKCKM